MTYKVWVMSDIVDVFNKISTITFRKNVHGFVTDIISSNFDVEKNSQTVERMRQRANDRIEYENERLMSR